MPLFFNKEPEMSSRRSQKDKDYVHGAMQGFQLTVAFGSNRMQRTGRLTELVPQAQRLRVEGAYFPRKILIIKLLDFNF